MKKNTLFALLFSPLAVVGQALTFDSTWQQKDGSNYYLLRKTVYANGNEYSSKEFIGNDATVFDNALKSSVNEGNRMATVAYEARDFDKTIKGIIELSDSLFAQTGMNLSDTLTARYVPALAVSGWKVIEEGAELAVSFSTNAGGALRYQISGFPERGGEVISNTLRLNNYKATGKSMDIYRAPGGNWFSVDDRVKMKHPDNQGI